MDYKSSILREDNATTILKVGVHEDLSKYIPDSFLTSSDPSEHLDSQQENQFHCLDIDSLYANLIMNTCGFLDFNTNAMKFSSMMVKNISEEAIQQVQDDDGSEEDWDYVQLFS